MITFAEFVNSTGSPYHSVLAARRMLESAGFKGLLRNPTSWDLERGGMYYVIENNSQILAFIIGLGFCKSRETSTGRNNKRKTNGIVILGSHTDSPCLKLRPFPNKKNESNEPARLGCMTYGSGLWHTWFDRPLGVAGKVCHRIPERSYGSPDEPECSTTGDETHPKRKRIQTKESLIRITEPFCIIPNLAIHLQTAEERKSFTVDPENHLNPIMLNNSGSKKVLEDMIATHIGIDPESIISHDLSLFEPSPAIEFRGLITCPRIDNLLSLWASLTALIEEIEFLREANTVSVVASFDHEECGSESISGAASDLVHRWIESLVLTILEEQSSSESRKFKDTSVISDVLENSILVSIDGAHATHPNYASKHQSEHCVTINGGIVFKSNANQRYATNCTTISLVRTAFDLHQAPIKTQPFVVRNDSPCGSTIGPILSTKLGIRAIDIGAPQLAMHSCRETCGMEDTETLTRACKAILRNWDLALNSHVFCDD